MDTDKIKQSLLQSKKELESRLERTHRHIYEKDKPVSANFNEQIKETENDELVLALEAEGKEELAMINRALQRLDAGEYAQCSGCGEAIGESRLEAIPYTDRCVDCASES